MSLGTKLAHVVGNLQQLWNVTQRAEDATGSHGVADALVHAVFKRNLIALPELLNTTGLNHDDNIFGVLQRLTPSGGSYSFPSLRKTHSPSFPGAIMSKRPVPRRSARANWMPHPLPTPGGPYATTCLAKLSPVHLK